MADKENIIDFTLTPKQQRIVDARILADDQEKRITYSHSTLCQTSLPFKNLGDDTREWKSRNGKSLVLIEAGQAYNPEIDDMVKLGLPFGPKPRLVLLYLNSQAIKQQSSEIVIEDSLHAFIKRIGLANTGRDIRTVKEQLARLSASDITIGRAEENGSGTTAYGRIVSKINVWFPKDENQRVLWPNTIKLSDEYYNSLAMHAVPLDEAALYALKDSALELDLYAMLAERLHRVSKPAGDFIPWAFLHEQYGSGYKRIDNFRAKFLKALENVCAVYPTAHIKHDKSSRGMPQGIRLFNSPPPIQKIMTQRPILKK